MNRLKKPEPHSGLIIPRPGDFIVAAMAPQAKRYRVDDVFVDPHHAAARLLPEDGSMDFTAYIVPICMLQPFLQHMEVIEGTEEDIERLQERRADLRRSAVAKLTKDEREALGL